MNNTTNQMGEAYEGRHQIINRIEQYDDGNQSESQSIGLAEWHVKVVAGRTIKLPEKLGLGEMNGREFGLIRRIGIGLLAILTLWALFSRPLGSQAVKKSGEQAFHFELLGDRTGEAQPGVFEEALREAAATKPAFILTVGDSIQGVNDAKSDAEWRAFEELCAPYRKIPLFLTPGNHDVWSDASAALFTKYSHHPLHYSFDHGSAHFVILDNSRGNDGPNAVFPLGELKFLENDLASHASQRVKFVVSHRPTWLFPAVLGNRQAPFHQLMLKYGVQYVIAGHVHQMLHTNLDGVMYLDMASSGGHLRDTKAYDRGWFFEHTTVVVEGGGARFLIHELKPPQGAGRETTPEDWSTAGLAR